MNGIQIFLNKVTQAKLLTCGAWYENAKTQWEKNWERIPQPMQEVSAALNDAKKKKKI